jgi:hypothetical protein
MPSTRNLIPANWTKRNRGCNKQYRQYHATSFKAMVFFQTESSTSGQAAAVTKSKYFLHLTHAWGLGKPSSSVCLKSALLEIIQASCLDLSTSNPASRKPANPQSPRPEFLERMDKVVSVVVGRAARCPAGWNFLQPVPDQRNQKKKFLHRNVLNARHGQHMGINGNGTFCALVAFVWRYFWPLAQYLRAQVAIK